MLPLAEVTGLRLTRKQKAAPTPGPQEAEATQGALGLRSVGRDAPWTRFPSSRTRNPGGPFLLDVP